MATGDGKTQGDGKTSPFGNGQGQVPGAGSMAGNDFVKNPAGGAPPGGGSNFLTNPSGAGPTGGAKPLNVVEGGKEAQKSGPNVDLNGESEIRDKGGLVPLIDRPDAGAGSIGNNRKPFKGI